MTTDGHKKSVERPEQRECILDHHHRASTLTVA